MEAPTALEYIPAPQLEQEADPATLDFPAGQVMQAEMVVPPELEDVPVINCSPSDGVAGRTPIERRVHFEE